MTIKIGKEIIQMQRDWDSLRKRTGLKPTDLRIINLLNKKKKRDKK